MNSLRFTGITLIAIAVGCFNPKYDQPNAGFACDTTTDECPSGYTCEPVSGGVATQGRCVKSSGGGGGGGGDNLSIPKNGASVTPMADPMLNDESMCPDAALEPDDDFGQAVTIPPNNLSVDAGPLKLQSLSICPTGKNPKANNHDVDLYKITVASSATLVVNVAYDIQYGDLDVGIFDTTGKIVSSDGTAKTNACVSSAVNSGTYYVGVFGANNKDVNRYTMTFKLSSAAASCQ